MGQEYQKNIVVKSTTPAPLRSMAFDDFEGAQQWQIAGNPIGYAGAIDTTTYYTGIKSLKINTRAATPAIGDFVQATRNFARIQANKIRITLYILVEPESTNDLIFTICPGGAANATRFGIRIDSENSLLKYRNSAGAWVTISGVAGYQMWGNFINLTLELDLKNLTYIQGWYNGQNFNLAGITGQGSVSSEETRSIVVSLVVTNTDTDQSIAYLDSVLIEAM